MQTLNLSTDTFDQDNTFIVEHVTARRIRRMTVSLLCDYKTEGDGIMWGLQKGVCLKSSYTDKDRAETARLKSMEPVRHGDVVTIEGRQYKARVLGDYSDCVVFDPA